MISKNFIPAFFHTIIIIVLTATIVWAQDPCPTYVDVLDNGWAHSLDLFSKTWVPRTDPLPFLRSTANSF